MPHLISFFEICLFGAGLYVFKQLLDLRRTRQLPPGPVGWPFVGSAFQLSAKIWEDYAALGKKYGEIVSLKVFGTQYIVLNSSRGITEVLEKQNAKSSDRPHPVMADMVGLTNAMAFLSYDDRFRQYRKFIARSFGSRNSASVFNPIVASETRGFLRNVLRSPDELQKHIRFTAGSISLKVTYGYAPVETKDQFVELARKLMYLVALLVAPGSFMVEYIPPLKYLPEWFPGAGFIKDVETYRQLVVESVSGPVHYVKKQMSAGTATPSFASLLLEVGPSPQDEDVIKWVSSQVYLGASDTIVSTLYGLFLAMVLYPEVQAKAQAELDSVVGKRLPTIEDRDSLPYVNALCKEALRWHTATPLAVPHVAKEDIYFDGYLIPKGAHIIGNAWAVLHDESVYPEPYVFRPERFLGESPQPDPNAVSFGYGRRVCPGIHFAEAEVFIVISMSLAALKFSKEIVNGVEASPIYDVNPGGISHPKPYKCKITARSAHVEALLHD